MNKDTKDVITLILIVIAQVELAMIIGNLYKCI